MKAPLILSVAAFLLAGASFLMNSSGLSSEAEKLPVGGVERTDASAVEQLQREMAELMERIDALEVDDLVPVAAAPREQVNPGWITEEQLEARLADLLGAEAASGQRKTGVLAMDAESFDAALQAARKRETTRKFEANAERRVQELDERVAKFEATLGLSPSQSSSLRAALENQQARNTELVRMWNEGATGLGQVKQDNRDAFLEELGGFLSEEQREAVVSGGGGGK
ncbi:MAG: hypothetical protein VX015_09310 [Planctomycetota bacterium]|jgi:hypothetical protein|nr:hypothetical protein [Planctomycetota bacterium]